MITKLYGLRCICKSCASIANKHYRNNNRQINANIIYTEHDVRTCSTCKQQKLYNEFYKCICDKSGLESYCKNCIKNNPNECFRHQFNTKLSSAIKSNNLNCLLIMGCHSHF